LTCAALPDGSLKPGNYTSRVEKKNNRLGPYGRKLLVRKAIKKGAAKPERTFLEKKSTCVSRRLGARKWRRITGRTKGNVSSVGPAHPKGKLRPIDTPRKRFQKNSESEWSACPSGLLIHIDHPCTPFPFSPAIASSRLRPPRPWPTSWPTPPLRSPPQLASAAAAAAAFTSPIPRRNYSECRACSSEGFSSYLTYFAGCYFLVGLFLFS
jgi:hypothetical protein